MTAAAVKAAVDQLPPLTDDQCRFVAELLRLVPDKITSKINSKAAQL
jgi:hypothetical protein